MARAKRKFSDSRKKKSEGGVERENKRGKGGDFKSGVTESKLFIEYYQAQDCVPKEEFDEWIESLRKPLPTTWRVNSTSILAEKLQHMLLTDFQYKDEEILTVEGDVVQPPSQLPWYPGGLGWQIDIPKNYVRKVPLLQKLHKWLIHHTSVGNISRQEAVSMLPPFFLNVQPSDVVLDMCAAPGSKTAQLLESLHKDGDDPKGVVVANDNQLKRASMLVFQLKRITSPALLVTSHDGQRYPNFATRPKVTAGDAPMIGVFDKILADVPCSGDGTVRKAADIWAKWSNRDSLVLHPLQLQIAKRAAELLKVGGTMVYSTCSYNPIENEAVVAALLKAGRGSLVLEDVSTVLPGLKYLPGVHTWKVMDKDNVVFESMSDVPEALQGKAIRATMFPPTEVESRDLGLHRCLRLMSHHQNTGGFFVSVIRKISVMPLRMELRTEVSPGKEGDDVSSEGDKDIATTSTPVVPEVKKERVKPIKAKKDAPPGSKAYEERRKTHPDDYVTASTELVSKLKEFYGISDDFPFDRLLVRSDSSIRNVTYVSQYVKEGVFDSPAVKKVNIVYSGLRMFAKNSKSTGFEYRLCQDGLNILLPYLTKRKVVINLSDYVKVLANTGKNVSNSELHPDTLENISSEAQGSICCLLSEDDARIVFPDDEVKRNALTNTHGIACWIGKGSLGAMVCAEDAISMLTLLNMEHEIKATEIVKKKGEDGDEVEDDVEVSGVEATEEIEEEEE